MSILWHIVSVMWSVIAIIALVGGDGSKARESLVCALLGFILARLSEEKT